MGHSFNFGSSGSALDVGTIRALLEMRDMMTPVLRKVEAEVTGASTGIIAKFGLIGEFGEQMYHLVADNLHKIPMALFNAAAAAEESENLFAVSFGNMADQARAWSVDLAAATGQNEFALREQAATLFVMMESMGVATESAYEMATALTGLAGDLASFYNLDHEDAFQKIQAGITGEAEPLKRLGILVTENTIKHAALAHGIIQAGEEMDEATKVQARYLAIMDQTVKAQGDLAATIDSPTNALRAMTAQWEALQIHLGQALMPIFRAVIMVMSSLLKIIMDNKDALVDYIKFGILALSHAFEMFITPMQFVIQGLGELWKWTLEVDASARKMAEAWKFAKTIVTTTEWSKAYDEHKAALDQIDAAYEKEKKRIDKSVASLVVQAEIVKINNQRFRDQVGVMKQGSNERGKMNELIEEGVQLTEKEIKAGIDYIDMELKRIEKAKKARKAAAEKWVEDMETQKKAAKEAQSTVFAMLDQNNTRIAQGFKDAEGSTWSFSQKFSKTISEAAKKLPGVIVGALQGGGDLFKSIGASIGGDIGTHLSNELATTLKGSLGDTLGGLIGGLIPGLGGLLGGLAGGLLDKGMSWVGGLFSNKEVEQVNDLRDAFFEAHGGFEAFSQSMAAVSDEDWAAKIFNAQTVEEFNALVIESQGLLDMQGLAQEELNAAIERYGFTIEELGPKFSQQRLDEMAGDLLKDYELLTAAGVNHNAIIERMGPHFNEYIQTAIKAGATIPEAMRPVVEEMIKQGKILDENGDAYGSVEEAGISFAQTMSEQFTTLIEKIDAMVNALLGINDINVSPKINYPQPPKYPTGGDYPGRPPGYAGGSGGFKDFGEGTLAMLHGKEAVVRPQDVAGLGNSNREMRNELRGLRGDLADLPKTLSKSVRDGVMLAQG